MRKCIKHAMKILASAVQILAHSQELNELMGTPLENIQIVPDEQDMKLWQVYMTGPVSLHDSIIQIQLTSRQRHHTPADDSISKLNSPSSSHSSLLKYACLHGHDLV